MLFRFTSSDLQNTTVIDCSTGEVAYRFSTPTPTTRSRSLSAASFYSFASSSSLSRENLSGSPQKSTWLRDAQDFTVAEIVWEDNTSSLIRIGEEEIAGTADIFDTSFMKVLPDETLIPTRMEYVWRMTSESLTLLDDDMEVIGRLYPDCVTFDEQLVLSSKPGAGHNFLELNNIPADELDEILVTFILISALRERMYWITKYVYGDPAERGTLRHSPLKKLRREASRSFASWKASLFRNRKP
ncbi:hypothetical protein BDY19DRAFT_908378 [Irpex rosettiformis]|uniref:Uncharacterized protein n=1 Tax=Irpex rosettiformis TaxID=378272 RepID=A0ACB8TWG2_9APHY|nr:hypothetical protein BDY19DRAFT_908378 [Irpex rosettiformis]